MSGSREGFFSRGCTRAFFSELGKTPLAREQFKISSMEGPTESKTSFRNDVGMESSAQEDDFIDDIVCRRVVSEIG